MTNSLSLYIFLVSKHTKESSNLIISSNKISEPKVMLKEIAQQKHNEVTTKSNEIKKSKFVRTSPYDSRTKRTETFRGREKFSIVSNTEKSVEDLVPYLYFGQKISTIGPRLSPELKSQAAKRPGSAQYTQLQPSTPIVPSVQQNVPKQSPVVKERENKEKEDDLEIMEVSAPKPSSTEKSKFWHNRINSATRNIVALNNYIRRMNSALHSSSTKNPNKNATSSTTIRYETIHSGAGKFNKKFNVKAFL